MRNLLLRQLSVGIVNTFVITSLTTLGINVAFNQFSDAQNRNKFFCGDNKGVPTTMVRTSRGAERMISWTLRDFISSGYTPKKRCQLVSAKFQRYYDNGEIYITSRNKFKGYPVLCISNRKGNPCSSENVLVTLPPRTDPGVALLQILDFRRGSSSEPIKFSGNQYITYLNNEFYLDVKQLVDEPNVESRF